VKCVLNQHIVASAARAAKYSTVSRGKVGAVLFSNSGKVLAQACNCPVWGYQDAGIFTRHAEEFLLAKAHKIRAADRFGHNNLNILVVRYKPATGLLANAKPCKRCAYYLKIAGFRVFHSDINGGIVRLTL
jgi:cytidine deaminase